MTNTEQLREIIHKPVTFTNETLQRDTDDLNKSLSQGYKIHDLVKTETGIVYVLGKWESISKEEISEKSEQKNDLKNVYENFLEECK